MHYDGRMENGLVYMRKTSSAEATKQLGSTLAPYLHTGDLVILSGDLGAGKTQFVQGVARGLGIESDVTSPSFNILLCYKADTGLSLYHFDLYRLDAVEQLEDIAFYETIESDGTSFVEWGEKFPQALPSSYLEVSFEIDDEGERKVKVYACGDRACEQLIGWAQDSKSCLMKCS